MARLTLLISEFTVKECQKTIHFLMRTTLKAAKAKLALQSGFGQRSVHKTLEV